MAWYDTTWDDVGDYYDELTPPDVNEILFGDHNVMDQHAQDLFQEAFFNNDDRAYFDLVDYMWEKYGIDFEASFDWEDFRSWYDSA